MARSPEAIVKSIRQKMATGWALRRKGGVIDLVLTAVATALADVEADAESLMGETDPRRANAILADFERCLGPDPCGRDPSELTVDQRRLLAFQRWTARGGQSIPYFVSIAAALGVTITIDEFWPSKAGVLRAGQRLRPEGCQFVWRVNIPGVVTVVNFKAGASRAGQSLGWFAVSAIECVIRRSKPAHTTVVFNYGEA